MEVDHVEIPLPAAMITAAARALAEFMTDAHGEGYMRASASVILAAALRAGETRTEWGVPGLIMTFRDFANARTNAKRNPAATGPVQQRSVTTVGDLVITSAWVEVPDA